MAFVDRPWDGSASRWPDAESYAKSCLIVIRKPGQPLTKEDCKLPVKEPNGDYNKNAIRNAAARLSGTDAPADLKKKAAERLNALKKQAGIGQD